MEDGAHMVGPPWDRAGVIEEMGARVSVQPSCSGRHQFVIPAKDFARTGTQTETALGAGFERIDSREIDVATMNTHAARAFQLLARSL